MQIYDLEFDLDGFIKDMEERSARRLAGRANRAESSQRDDCDDSIVADSGDDEN